MQRRQLGILPGGVLGLALALGACDKGEPEPDAAPKSAGVTKSEDAKAGPAKADDGHAAAADAKANAEAKIDDAKADDAKADDAKADADAKADDAKADADAKADDAGPDPSAPVPTPTAVPGSAPTAPVVVDGELSLAPEHIGDLHLGMTAADVTAKLGAPKKKSKIEEEGATGDFVQDWEYPDLGLTLGMRADSRKGPQTVRNLTADATCTLPASWGLEIGSTRAEVEKVYGSAFDPDFTDEDQLVAGSVYGGVFYTFEGGKVTGIFIGAGAE